MQQCVNQTLSRGLLPVIFFCNSFAKLMLEGLIVLIDVFARLVWLEN